MPLPDKPTQQHLIAEIRRLANILDRPLKHGRLDMADLIKALEVKGDLSGIARAVSESSQGISAGLVSTSLVVANISAAVDVPHGLARAPTAVVCSTYAKIGFAGTTQIFPGVTDTFRIWSFTTGGAPVTDTILLYWIAVT